MPNGKRAWIGLVRCEAKLSVMSTLSLRLPESLHRQVRELAQRNGVSINQFVTLAVAQKVAALTTGGRRPSGYYMQAPAGADHRAAPQARRRPKAIRLPYASPRRG